MALPIVGVDVRALLVDSNGAPLAVGGGTQYTDGVTQANPTGNVVEWLDTSNVIRAVSATKPLPVNVVAGSGSGVSVTDAAAWTTAVSVFVPNGGVFNDSAAALTAGQQGTVRSTANRAAHANLRDSAGVELLPVAALLADTFDTAVTKTTMLGSVMYGLTQGATTVSRIKAHDGGSDDRGTTINGLVASAYGYVFDGTNWDRQRSGGVTGMAGISGDTAHDGVDAGNPVKIGMRAVSHGATPTSVAAADRTDWLANRAGIPFMMGGHPNIITLRYQSTGAETNTALITVSTGTKIVVTRITVTASNANTLNPSVIIGFATVTTPTTTGVIASDPGIPPGGGFTIGDGSGILGVGANDEDLRITSTTTSTFDVNISYFTIAA